MPVSAKRAELLSKILNNKKEMNLALKENNEDVLKAKYAERRQLFRELKALGSA